MPNYRYKTDTGGEVGPVSLQTLQMLYRNGKLSDSTLARNEGESDWVSLSALVVKQGTGAVSKKDEEKQQISTKEALLPFKGGSLLYAGYILFTTQLLISMIALALAGFALGAAGVPGIAIYLVLFGILNLLLRVINAIGRSEWSVPVTTTAIALELLTIAGQIGSIRSPSLSIVSASVERTVSTIGLLLSSAAAICFVFGFRAAWTLAYGGAKSQR